MRYFHVIPCLAACAALISCIQPNGKKKNNAKTPAATAVTNGPGFFDASFESNSSFLKVTLTPLLTTQHADGQGKNADIWYSSNIQSLFGSASASAPEGTVAIKKFSTPDNQIMVTGMVKKNGSWQYYMGPQSQFPTAPIASMEAQMCIGCHQATGSQTDQLPYLSKAQISGSSSSNATPGPGAMDANFKISSQFVKGTQLPLPTTQHGEGKGKNAEIWYSTNIKSLFGQTSVPSVPTGTVAIKQFLTADNKTMITGMVKAGGTWQYYMGPATPFPTTPLPSSDAQMCIGCHQSTGSQTDMLPYLSKATGI